MEGDAPSFGIGAATGVEVEGWMIGFNAHGLWTVWGAHYICNYLSRRALCESIGVMRD